MSDDQEYQAMSCNNIRLNRTPKIDRIAHEGVICFNSFVTNSICTPGLAVMLTGKFSQINGHRDSIQMFDDSPVTFLKLLQKAGYGEITKSLFNQLVDLQTLFEDTTAAKIHLN